MTKYEKVERKMHAN